MDTLDERLAAFRGYVPDPTVDDARAAAARSWQPRRRGVQWRLLVPAAGVMFAGVVLALLVSRDDRDHVVPGTQSTSTTVRTDARTGTARGTSVPRTETPATTSNARPDTTPRSSTTTQPRVPGGTTSTPAPSTSSSSDAVVSSCGEIVVEPPDGGFGLIYAIRDVRGMTCTDAKRIAALTATDRPLPTGWHCDTDVCWQGGDLAEAVRRFTYVFGGDAG